MPDRQDMFAPTRGADQGGATLVAIATTFALGAESKRLPVCLFVCLFVVVLLLLLLLTPSLLLPFLPSSSSSSSFFFVIVRSMPKILASIVDSSEDTWRQRAADGDEMVRYVT